MQRSKLIILIFTLLISIKFYSQPSPKKNFLKLNFSINDTNFKTQDSVTFYSLDNKISLTIYEITNNNFSKREKIKLSNDFKDKAYTFNISNSIFEIKIIKSIFSNNEILSTRKILLEIEKNNCLMKVFFNLPLNDKEMYVNNLNIIFRKGTFEITDSKNPILIAKKEDN